LRDEVAGIAANFFPGIVDPNLRAELFHLVPEAQRNVSFFS
jgi:hypothetical protein